MDEAVPLGPALTPRGRPGTLSRMVDGSGRERDGETRAAPRERGGAPEADESDRETRRARQLRANLKKRKQQQRARRDG